MKGILALDDSVRTRAFLLREPPLTHRNTPALVTDINKHIVSAVEGAERHSPGPAYGAELEDFLDEQHCLLQTLTRNADALLHGNDTHGAVLPHQRGGQVERLDAVTQRVLCYVEKLNDVPVIPGGHLGGHPVLTIDRRQEVRRGRVELEEIVGFATHDDQRLLLRRRQVGAVGYGVKKTVQALEVALGVGVTCCGDDADFDVFAKKVCGGRDNGCEYVCSKMGNWKMTVTALTKESRNYRAVGFQVLAIIIERHVTIKGGKLKSSVSRHSHYLGRVKDQADVVERRRDEAA